MWEHKGGSVRIEDALQSSLYDINRSRGVEGAKEGGVKDGGMAEHKERVQNRKGLAGWGLGFEW